MVSREVLQKYVYENTKDKPKGAMFYNNKTYFKISRNRAYYYHRSQKKWEIVSIFTLDEVRNFFKLTAE